jgi:hypothetical protein
MSKEVFLKKIGIPRKNVLANIWLISNVLIWYFCAFFILKSIITEIGLNYLDSLLIWFANFGGAVLSALIGAVLVNEAGKRLPFFAFWIILGVFSSFMLLLMNTALTSNLLLLSSLFGVSFGIGLPACMGYYSDSIAVEERARLAGIILFISYVGMFVLLTAIMASDVLTSAVILVTWRGLGLAILLLIKSSESTIIKGKSFSYTSILSQKPFLFYFIPWLIFSLVNSLSIPIQSVILGESLVELLLLIENVLVGVFAIVGGFLSDFLGRKRMAITGFVMLGLGYAILGIYSENLVSWYFYTVVDGAAWGILHVILLLTIWGDLAYGAPSEKYYALGGLPYLLSSFLRITLGSYIAETIPAYAIFSFVAFFLFLAVLPLMYAPETLPEKKIRERELKGYIDKAKKVKEKYT